MLRSVRVGFGTLVGLAGLAAVATSVVGPPVAAETANKIKIAFVGDSIVDNYWSGISRVVAADACMKKTVELGRYAKNGTGLTRGDKLYWPRQVAKIGESFQPQMFVASVGLNDRQFIIDANGARTPWGSPSWLDKYRAEITEFLKGASASKALVLLIGLPVMREAVDNTDAIEKNKMFADAVAQFNNPRVQYVEPWRLNATGEEAFTSYGKDKNDKMVQIRQTDGQHFTVAGEDLVAPYLFQKIAAAFANTGVQLGKTCATITGTSNTQ